MKRDIELLFELGCIRHIPRVWSQFLAPNFANLAEHHFRVIWLSLLIAKMENKGDVNKIMQMALIHDLAESRTGDVHNISRQYTKRDELKAIKDILKNTSVEKEFLKLWQEYEKRDSIEAKIVKDADWLDVDLEISEQKAAGRIHMKAWDQNRKIIYHNFFTNTAKKLWKQIQSSDPTNWYKNARNRFREGDMRPKKK